MPWGRRAEGEPGGKTMNVSREREKELLAELRSHPSVVIVAIDGPGASGKSSTARALAELLGFLYVDTGAMYRTLAWHCLGEGVDMDSARSVSAACRRWKTSLVAVEGEVRLLVGGKYPGTAIRTPAVAEAASKVAVIPAVRKWMKATQRECGKFGSVVMEGRDIGTNVFPETDFKFFLDASPEERAKRRAAQGVKENLAERDRRDSQRRAAPLMIPLGAALIDNSGKTVEATAREIAGIVGERLRSGAGRRN